MNYVDLFIIFVACFYGYTGYRYGFLRVLFDMTALIASFFIALVSHISVSSYIQKSFGMRESFSLIIGFFITWTATEVLFYLVVQLIYPKIPEKIRNSKINKYGGILPSAIKGLFIISLFAVTVATVPFQSDLKDAVNNSKIGKPLAKNVSFLNTNLDKIFGGAFKEATEFVTIKPESNETIDLGFTVTDVNVDEVSEAKMLELVNKERVKAGLGTLVMDDKLVAVARKHSVDMFARGYFAHENPDGLSPFDRMEAGGVKFLAAGENLALAPDADKAHVGLMNSPGHRANILSADFNKVGIGVIDGGAYGKMFTQNFTD